VSPGAQVLGLFGRERIENDAEGRELEPGHLHVDLLGDVVDAVGEILMLAAQVLGAERLFAKLMSMTAAG